MSPNNVKVIEWSYPQQQFYRDKSAICILDGPVGSGKSGIAYQKMVDYCRTFPESTALIVRKKAESLENSVISVLKKRYVKALPDMNWVTSRDRFEFDNGSHLICKGMFDEDARESLKSIGQEGAIDIALMEEATEFVEDDLVEILSRTRGHSGDFRQVILACNPQHPQHWLYKNWIQPLNVYLKNDDMIFSRSEDDRINRYNWMAYLNPFADEEYLATVRGFRGHQYYRRYMGLWVHAEGLVYENFDIKMHLINPFRIPDHWERYRSIDFGMTDPTCVQWWTRRPSDGAMFMYREIYTTGKAIDLIGKMIEENSVGEHYAFTVADHDADKRDYLKRNFGIGTVLAYKDIDIGIELVSSRLDKKEFPTEALLPGQPPLNQTGLYIFKNALCHPVDKSLEQKSHPTRTAEEFVAYQWAKGKEDQLFDIPDDKYNHGMDAARYYVAAVDGLDLGGSVLTAADIEQMRQLMVEQQQQEIEAGAEPQYDYPSGIIIV